MLPHQVFLKGQVVVQQLSITTVFTFLFVCFLDPIVTSIALSLCPQKDFLFYPTSEYQKARIQPQCDMRKEIQHSFFQTAREVEQPQNLFLDLKNPQGALAVYEASWQQIYLINLSTAIQDKFNQRNVQKLSFESKGKMCQIKKIAAKKNFLQSFMSLNTSQTFEEVSFITKVLKSVSNNIQKQKGANRKTDVRIMDNITAFGTRVYFGQNAIMCLTVVIPFQAIVPQESILQIQRTVLRRWDRNSYQDSLTYDQSVGAAGSSPKQRLPKATHYNYFIIMNYFALNHSVPFSTVKVPQNQTPQSPIPFPLILQTISMALANSLKNYHNVLLANDSHVQTPKQAAYMMNQGSVIQKTPNKEPDAQSLLRLPEEIQIKHIPKEKGVLTRKDYSSRAKTNHHLSTSQEPVEQRPQKAKLIREERTRNKSAVECLKGDSSSLTVSQPVVDLIENAYLPKCGMKRSEIAGIRSKLEQRIIYEWNDKVKLRQYKRELRLLGC